MRASTAAAWARRAITPPAISAIEDGLAFGRAHHLSSRRRDWILGYRTAVRIGLHYLPDGFAFDGLIIDVGANRGLFTAAMRQLEPRCRVLAIEPDPTPRADLERRFASDPQVTVDPRAISDHDGTATFNAMEVSEYSSLHRLRGDDIAVVGERQVETTTLDSLVSEPVRLLKIDVQGHDLPLLRGATATLARTDAVLLEVMFVSLYEGDATFGELDEVMRDAGFVLAGLVEPASHQSRVVFTDACYLASRLRPGESVAEPDDEHRVREERL